MFDAHSKDYSPTGLSEGGGTSTSESKKTRDQDTSQGSSVKKHANANANGAKSSLVNGTEPIVNGLDNNGVKMTNGVNGVNGVANGTKHDTVDNKEYNINNCGGSSSSTNNEILIEGNGIIDHGTHDKYAMKNGLKI